MKTTTYISFLISSFFYLILSSSCKHEPEDIILGLGTTDAIGKNGAIPIDSTQFLKLNEIQIIASHYSYRLYTDPAIFNFVQTIKGALPANLDPDGWDYTHLPIPEQLQDYHIRGLELDIFYDPNGGQFYNRQGNLLAGKPVASGEPKLQTPGFKIIHIPDLDYNTSVLTFKDGLIALRDWSLANPNHLPIFVNIETKEGTPATAISGALPFPIPGFVLTQSVPYDASAVSALDEEIRDVFGANLENVFSPDELCGSYSTLRDAALAGNWPKLKDVRGKVVFIIEGGGSNEYIAGSSILAGKACFVYTDLLTEDFSSFIILNNPKTDQADIESAVLNGFIVRTRSDSDTKEARIGDYSSKDAAFNSGAQIISADYYKSDSRAGTPGWTDYKVNFSEGIMFRTNPI